MAPPNERKPQAASAKIAHDMTRMQRSGLAVIDGPFGKREFGGNGTALFPDADFGGHASLTAITQTWLGKSSLPLIW